MGSRTMTTGIPVGRRTPRAGIRAGIADSARGLVFCGLALAGAGLVLALAAPLVLAALGLGFLLNPPHGMAIDVRVLPFAGLGVSLTLLPGVLLSMRRLANLTRRLAGKWCGVPIAQPYRRPPGASGEKLSFRRRLSWLLGDPATWRDLLWMTGNACVGWVLAAAAAGLVASGLIGVVWGIASGPPHFPQDSRPVLVVLGVGATVLGLWAAPWLLRAFGGLASSKLAPAGQGELALQVRHLAETRSETIDTGAAEIRRIERDLHDGAQARLVAMGMTLDAAGYLINDNPAAAQTLLLEARDSSVKALAEGRDLVRGICPPVLADRGLADAVRALALDSPLRTHLASELPGRPPVPVESAAYFAVSELLANAAKHAEASQTWIDLRHTDGMLRIGITDDGRGGADPAHGTGLHGIERRLAAFDGVLAVSSPPGGPTAMIMEIPCALTSPTTSAC